MLTALNKDDLMTLGARYRADYLTEQAGYTLGVAALDRTGLKDLLPQGYLDEMNTVMAQVNAARQDKTLVAAEAKDATRAQNAAFRDAKVWRRKVSRRAMRATRMGKDIPEGLIKISQARTVPALAGQLVEMVKLMEKSRDAMTGSEALVEQGKTLAKTLGEADTSQEVKRQKDLPDAVRRFYEQKGLLYTGLKIINDAGHELHADDATAAARYNLSILHRQANKKTAGKPA